MRELLKDKASEVLTMLELSNEFPADYAYVDKLMKMENEKRAQGESLTEDERQSDYVVGAVEAKVVYLGGKHWDDLLKDEDLQASPREGKESARPEAGESGSGAKWLRTLKRMFGK